MSLLDDHTVYVPLHMEITVPQVLQKHLFIFILKGAEILHQLSKSSQILCALEVKRFIP